MKNLEILKMKDVQPMNINEMKEHDGGILIPIILGAIWWSPVWVKASLAFAAGAAVGAGTVHYVKKKQ